MGVPFLWGKESFGHQGSVRTGSRSSTVERATSAAALFGLEGPAERAAEEGSEQLGATLVSRGQTAGGSRELAV